jgi:hypothetical protein
MAMTPSPKRKALSSCPKLSSRILAWSSVITSTSAEDLRCRGEANNYNVWKLALARCQHHDHLPTFHRRELLDLGEFEGITFHSFKNGRSQFLVTQLAAPET